MIQTGRKRGWQATAGCAVTAALIAMPALPAAATEPDNPAGARYTVQAFAAVGAETKPDDITRLGEFIYVSFQNDVGPLGEPAVSGVTASTIQQYAPDGRPGKSWHVQGRVDGLTADPAEHRLLLTANEDGNSRFGTLTPGADDPLHTYNYTGLTHGGGTDAITVFHRDILISASNPADSADPAAYRVQLHGDSADLTPLFHDNSAAVAANGPHAGHRVALALTDPDSNTKVPATSSRFQGDFLLDAQGDRQLIFTRDPGIGHQELQVLTVPQPLDDTAFAQS